MDDVLSGAHTISEGREKIAHIIGLFKAGGFPLQKWVSSHDELLDGISTADRAAVLSLSLDREPLYRALGLSWRPFDDAFVFTIKDYAGPTVVTKRTVLSRTAQLFDPLGWITPVIVQAKILMQELWAAQLTWDEALPPTLLARWQDYIQQLADVSLIKVPRWLGLSPTVLAVELHGFSDASQTALGAVVYLRVLTEVDEAFVSIVSAKSKVAPLNRTSKTTSRARAARVTIPRLELSAAVLLVRLLSYLRVALNLEAAPIHLWTDSTTTLFWVKGHPSRWKDFVRNRVAQIQDTLPAARWHHVRGDENPADLASRGAAPSRFAKHRLWWQGSAWLKKHFSLWPDLSTSPSNDVDLEERPLPPSQGQ